MKELEVTAAEMASVLWAAERTEESAARYRKEPEIGRRSGHTTAEIQERYALTLRGLYHKLAKARGL